VDFFAQGTPMLRPSARLATVLLIGTALSACSTLSPDKPSATKAEVKPAASVKSMAADLDGQITAAQQLRGQGDYQGATKILSQLMLVAPDNARVVGEYGKTLVQQGRAKEALDFLKRGIELSPSDWSLYSASGVAYDQNGQYASAKVAYQQALAIRPGNAAVLNNYGLSRMQAGDLSGARQLFAQAQASGGGNDPKIASNLALLASLSPTPVPAVVSAKAPTPVPTTAAPKFAAARGPAPKPAVADTVMMEQVPTDSKAGPVKTATAAPRKLLLKETSMPVVAAAHPPKKIAAAPTPKKTAAAVTPPPKKVVAAVTPKPDVKKASPATKTPSLRMTADAATP
jgi:Flp pilus assembly protein TadD